MSEPEPVDPVFLPPPWGEDDAAPQDDQAPVLPSGSKDGPPGLRDFPDAEAFAHRQHERPAQNWHNMCQGFSRQCVGAPAFGASARLAFNGIAAKHRRDSSPPPAGSIAYYGPADHGFGHAVFVVDDGWVWSNDILRVGKIDRVRWDVFPARWGLEYRGWIDRCPAGDLPVQRTGPGLSARLGDAPSDDRPGRTPSRYRQERRVYHSRMRLGQRDSDSVWNLQTALGKHGHRVAGGASAAYDEATLKACAAFQRAQGWTGADADGIAGPQTVDRLGLVWVDD